MGFVECILRKIDHFIIDLIGCLFINSIFNTARHTVLLISIDKDLALFLHHIALFLGHGTAKKIASSQCVSGKVTHDLHNLLLIDNTSVSRRQNRLQLRTVIGDRSCIIFSPDILWDKVHRTRTVQGNPGNDIFQAVWLQFFHEALHPSALQLEDSIGLPGSDIRKNLFVVIVDLIHIKFRIFAFCKLHRILDHSQRPKSQEVHF